MLLCMEFDRGTERSLSWWDVEVQEVVVRLISPSIHKVVGSSRPLSLNSSFKQAQLGEEHSYQEGADCC